MNNEDTVKEHPQSESAALRALLKKEMDKNEKLQEKVKARERLIQMIKEGRIAITEL